MHDKIMVNAKKTVAIVIANFNGEDSLPPTIESVLTQDYSVQEIILADNRSTDGSIDLVKQRFPSVRILETSGNRGPNIARNCGLKNTDADLVLIMDNDIILSKNYVSTLVQIFKTFPSAGAAGGQIRLHAKPDQIQYRGVDIHYVGAAIDSHTEQGKMEQVGALSAGAMLVDREKALYIGEFDEDFVFGWEDGDFSFRLTSAGFPCYVTTRADAYHLKKKRGLKWVRYQVRNRWWFILKNYDARTIILALPAILFYQCCIGGVCLLKGRFWNFLAGSCEAVSSFSDVMEKRKSIIKIKKVHDSELLSGMDIDMLGDIGNSRFIRIGAGIANKILSAYWQLIKCFLR